MKNRFTLENCRSYSNEKNLQKGLEKLGFDKDRYVVAYTAEGRVTAIFGGTSNFPNGGYVALYAQHGFLTFN